MGRRGPYSGLAAAGRGCHHGNACRPSVGAMTGLRSFDGGSRLVPWVVTAIGAYDALYLGLWLARGDSPRFGDFFALWTFGRFALTQPLPGIYDPAGLQAFQHSLDAGFSAAYPFFYPPSFLLLAVPIGWLPLVPAWLIWCCSTALLYIAAALGRRWRHRAAAALLVAPTTLLCIVAGQSGLLTGALMLGGLRLVRGHPWAGGALLGLLVLKPQLGLLIPVALVAAGEWRAVAAAALAAAAAIGLAVLAFGGDIWLVWAQTLAATADLALRHRDEVVRMMPTVAGGLFDLGLPDGVVRVLQLVAGLAAALVTWRAFRRGVTAEAAAVLTMATFLATPYAYIYDLPMVTGALVLLALTRRLSLAEATLCCLISVVPLGMLSHRLPLVEPALLAAAVGWLAYGPPAVRPR